MQMKSSMKALLVGLTVLSFLGGACKSGGREEPTPPPPTPQPEKPKEYLKPNPIRSIRILDEDENLVTTAFFSEAGDLSRVIVELAQTDGRRELAQEYLYDRTAFGNRITRYTNHGLRGTKAEWTYFRYKPQSYYSLLPNALRKYYNGVERIATYTPLGTTSHSIDYVWQSMYQITSKRIDNYETMRSEYVQIQHKWINSGGVAVRIHEYSRSSFWGSKRPELETTIDIDEQGREVKRTFIDYEGGGSVDGATYWTSLTTETEYKYDTNSPYLSQLGYTSKKETISKALQPGVQIYTESYQDIEQNEYGLVSKRWRNVRYSDTSQGRDDRYSHPQIITYEYYPSKK